MTQWTGVRVRDLARAAGAMPEAAVIAYGYDGRALGPAHNAPARLHSPVKPGYKNVNHLTRVAFLPARNGGYWSDQGYEWYGGT